MPKIVMLICGNKKSTGVDLIVNYDTSNDVGGKIVVSPTEGDPNHGEIFWYDKQNTLLDDLQGDSR